MLLNIARIVLALSAGYLLMNDRRFRGVVDKGLPESARKAVNRVIPHPSEAKNQRTASETARRAGREAQDFMAP